MSHADVATIPHQSYGALFLRFLRFGSLAWGGPVAQIAMIKGELVEEERWITPDRFNRALAVYQVLPGPEAHELCVYFGMLARGRVGGFLAGLGFMLPGFVLMLLLSWLYVSSQGALAQGWAGVFLALQAAVVALIVRAVHRIGSHALHDRWLFGLAALALAGSLVGVHFSINLAVAGALYFALRERRRVLVAASVAAWLVAVGIALSAEPVVAPADVVAASVTSVSPALLFVSGLKSGLLTFGGAYTVIPFLQRDAVVTGSWMTNDQFLDGLALSGILPAPLIIFATFVGYLGGRLIGSLALTVGIFLPAFGFTLVAHDPLERITQRPGMKHALDGVTAGVVGLIAATTVQLAPAALGSTWAAAIFAGSLALLYLVKHKLNVLLVIACAAAVGALVL
ncbi:MAG: chromate efflux transporter [Planctomycetota bacterium]